MRGRIGAQSTIQLLKGDALRQRNVVLEFPSMAQLRAWYRSPARPNASR